MIQYFVTNLAEAKNVSIYLTKLIFMGLTQGDLYYSLLEITLDWRPTWSATVISKNHLQQNAGTET